MTSPILHTIMKVHIKRLGLGRVILGAFGMYVTIPVFFLIHGFVIHVLVMKILLPLCNEKNIEAKNFIILDRYKVSGLSRIDAINCMFCGWVNGLCTLFNHTLDELSKNAHDVTFVARLLIYLIILLYTLPGLVIQTIMHLWTNTMVAAPLRLEKISYRAITKEVLATYAIDSGYSQAARWYLSYQKITWTALERALEQVESAWCPIRHFERMESVVYPPHHKLFFEPEQIADLCVYLSEHGTVLSRDSRG